MARCAVVPKPLFDIDEALRRDLDRQREIGNRIVELCLESTALDRRRDELLDLRVAEMARV